MQFTTHTVRSIDQLKTPALFIGVFKDKQQSAYFNALDTALGGDLSKLLKQDFKADAGDHFVIYHPQAIKAERLVLVGLGQKSDYTPNTLKKALERLVDTCKELSLTKAHTTLLTETEHPTELARLVARVCYNRSYTYTTTLGVSKSPLLSGLQSLGFIIEKKDQAAIEEGFVQGTAVGQAMHFTRELGNLPSNICTPSYLAEQAKSLAKNCPQITVQVLDKKQIQAEKMNAFLAVAAGSDEPPKFIVLKYKARKASKQAPIVFVGKGITFDSGGLSLKPHLGMDEMKYDMCGAATVLGLFKFLATLGDFSRDVVGLIASTENMPSGHATKPGDIVTSLSGQTIEILNTDAEGRLILCDTLTYAERFNPAAVIDIATLTGAVVVALGKVNSGLFSNDQALGHTLRELSLKALDPVWSLPLDDEYQPALKSNFADMANIGGRAAGSTIAACFLSRFTKKYAWAHLDVAATAWDKEGEYKGATGRPVPLLTDYLLTLNNA